MATQAKDAALKEAADRYARLEDARARTAGVAVGAPAGERTPEAIEADYAQEKHTLEEGLRASLEGAGAKRDSPYRGEVKVGMTGVDERRWRYEMWLEDDGSVNLRQEGEDGAEAALAALRASAQERRAVLGAARAGGASAEAWMRRALVRAAAGGDDE